MQEDVPAVVLRHPDEPRRPFRVVRAATGPALADVVEWFWAVEWSLPPGTERVQEVLTHPCAHLTVEDGVGWVQGVLTRRFRRLLTGSGHVIGARLLPSGLSTLGIRPAVLVDRRLPAAELLDVTGLAAVSDEPDLESGMAALEGWLTARAPCRPDDARLVDEAVALAAADPELTRVDELAARLGVPVRTLQRRFDRHLGVGPKSMLQRVRLQDALEGIEAGADTDWAGLAARLGFADQPHFVNAFTAVVGVPPGEYRRRASLTRSADESVGPAS